MDKYLKYLINEDVINDDSLKYLGRHNNTRDDVPEDQLKLGIEVEMEHVANGTPKAMAIEIATRIALDHISSCKTYYTRLLKMEKECGVKEEDKWETK